MLDSQQRKFLSAEALKGAVIIQLGKGGPSEAFSAQLKAHLAVHELVKVRFVNHQENRREIAAQLAQATESELVRVIGNTALFFKG
ncbi:MAG: YhbY family RNA-binding protein [Spirochaetes bacterium]|nr:YhbY family RNA-binding protein [Spirochaetota bacterium]